MTQVLVVSDVRLYREGLAEILGRDGRLSVVGAVAGAAEALERADRLRPEAVLVDMATVDAFRVVRGLVTAEPERRVIALGVCETSQAIVECAEAGVSGYVGRESSIEELIDTVETALVGELRCSARIAAALMRRVGRLAAAQAPGERAIHLTRRELEVVELLDRGMANKEIASSLGIELSTVKNHVHNILDKLGVRRRGEAAARVRRTGLLGSARQTQLLR